MIIPDPIILDLGEIAGRTVLITLWSLIGFFGNNILFSARVLVQWVASEKAKRKIETPLFDAERLNLSDTEKTTLNALDHEPAHVEQLIAKTSLTAGAVNAALVSLRLKGLIKHLPGNMFIKL